MDKVHSPINLQEVPLKLLVDELVRRGALGTVPLLQIVRDRGGHPGVTAEAVLLCARKSDDYNQGMGHADMHAVNRDSYFPFGLKSHAQMIHTKAERLVSLARKDGESQFEGARDTCLDLINYAGFAADFLKREAAKKDPQA